MDNDCKSFLEADPTDWLLEPENPSIRYFTLVDLLDNPLDEPEVLEAKETIGTSRVVTRIFSKQKPGGYWESEAEPYKPKYKSTYWQPIILGLLGLDRGDERVRGAVDYTWGFQHEDGGFCEKMEEGARIKYERVRGRMARRGKEPPPSRSGPPARSRSPRPPASRGT